MAKIIEENERIKRKYYGYLKGPKKRDEKTINKVAAAISKYEKSTNYKPFKKFHIEHATKFRMQLESAKRPITNRPLSHSTIDSTLRMVKAFFFWLAGEPGYKSRIAYRDVEYFNNSLKSSRIAHTKRSRPYPSQEQCKRAFEAMPENTEEQMRDKAAFAAFMLVGGRNAAVTSLLLKHINLEDGSIFQDAREVNTKFAKTFTSWYFPVDQVYIDYFEKWVRYLREEKLYGPEDAVFPKSLNGFKKRGFSRECYAGTAKLNEIMKNAFAMVQMPEYTPHSVRKTLTLLINSKCETMEEVKACSLNLGHEDLRTTINSYLPVSPQRQGEIMKNLRKRQASRP